MYSYKDSFAGWEMNGPPGGLLVAVAVAVALQFIPYPLHCEEEIGPR